MTAPKKAPAKPKVSQGARKVIAQVLEEGITPERIKNIVDAAFAAEVAADAVCPDCGASMKIKTPDLKKQVETMIALLDQAEGRPGQNQPEATTIVIERPPL